MRKPRGNLGFSYPFCLSKRNLQICFENNFLVVFEMNKELKGATTPQMFAKGAHLLPWRPCMNQVWRTTVLKQARPAAPDFSEIRRFIMLPSEIRGGFLI